MTHVFTVQEAFDIAGRFIALLPGIPPEHFLRLKGEVAELRRPDGSTITVKFTVPLVDPFDPKRPHLLGIAAPFTKEDAPVGTEVRVELKE